MVVRIYQGKCDWNSEGTDIRDSCHGEPGCVESCPVDGILERNGGLVVRDPGSCYDCNACVDACQKEALYIA